ncbi:hypothetical protein CMV_027110 [Castanea mollissima]|uniref:Uncharacterized protein n=1 Tax=Castanea mollissima TaxID=60419 RepID=A0A8J4V328_9ROSI|nr:hypothetical protein CMV_027110 [Castanea mollissima]
MLRHYIINTQGPHDVSSYYVTIPGSEIPKWFSHQNVGTSHHPLHQPHIRDYDDMIGDIWEEILNKVNANGFSQIEVEFDPQGPGLEVTKCGAHLLSFLFNCVGWCIDVAVLHIAWGHFQSS